MNVGVLIEYNVEILNSYIWQRIFFSQDIEKAKEAFEQAKKKHQGARLNRMICTQTNLEEFIQ